MSGFRANSIVNRDGTGAPNFPNGIVATGATFTQVSSVNATFSGNLTIGGTVSYQEVENIDAVGVITAQQGIQVEANGLTVTGVGTFNNPIEVVGVTTADANGLNVAGVITATTLKGSGANLTGILPTLSGIASGTLANGQTVIIHSDGKVGGISTTGIGQTVGSVVNWNGGTWGNASACYDTNVNRVVISYRDNSDSGKGKAVVGTITGTAVTFGTAVQFDSSSTGNHTALFDPTTNKIVIVYKENSNEYAKAVVGTPDASDNSITFGSVATVQSNIIQQLKATIDTDTGRVIACYQNQQVSGSPGQANVGTVSGTSISFGSNGSFNSTATTEINPVYDPSTQKVVVIFSDEGNSYQGKYVVGSTTSDTAISWGSAATYATTNTQQITATVDTTSNRVVIAFKDVTNSLGKSMVGTVNANNTMTWGSATTYHSYQADYNALVYDSTREKIVLTYADTNDSNKGILLVGTVNSSNNTIAFGSGFDFNYDGGGYQANNNANAFDPDTAGVIIPFKNVSSSNGNGVVIFNNAFTDTNLKTTNFLGFSNAAYTDGQTATIQITGATDDAQSGLTTARKHYVQNDGTLSTTAGTPSVEAGVAISDTTIIVKG